MLGLGCALSSLVTGALALGSPLTDAVVRAHAIVQRAVEHPRRLADGVSRLSDLRAAVAAVDGQGADASG